MKKEKSSNLCKECRKEQRRNGSAFGIECAKLHRVRMLNAARLQKRIADAALYSKD